MRKKRVLSSDANIGGSTTMNGISRQHHSLQLPLVEVQAARLKVPATTGVSGTFACSCLLYFVF